MSKEILQAISMEARIKSKETGCTTLKARTDSRVSRLSQISINVIHVP